MITSFYSRVVFGSSGRFDLPAPIRWEELNHFRPESKMSVDD